MTATRQAEERASRLYELDMSRRRSRVLLAEDDPAFRRLIAAALRRDGFEVIEVGDGRALVAQIASTKIVSREAFANPIDLVISDIRMPSMTGLEAIAGLRCADWAIPVILMTAFGDESTRTEALRLGADAVFDKPFDLVDLRTMALHLVSD